MNLYYSLILESEALGQDRWEAVKQGLRSCGATLEIPLVSWASNTTP